MGFLAGIAVCTALLVGFAAGFALFRRAQRWCPGCGATISPAHCPHAGTSREAASVPSSQQQMSDLATGGATCFRTGQRQETAASAFTQFCSTPRIVRRAWVYPIAQRRQQR